MRGFMTARHATRLLAGAAFAALLPLEGDRLETPDDIQPAGERRHICLVAR